MFVSVILIILCHLGLFLDECHADSIAVPCAAVTNQVPIYVHPSAFRSGQTVNITQPTSTDCAAYLIPITAGPTPATIVLTDGTVQTVAPIISGTPFAFLPVNSVVTNRITTLSCNGCSFPIDCTDVISAQTSSGSGAVCFSADAKLRLMNGETKRMDELELNDWVLAVNNSQAVYSNVDSWYHRVPDQTATFISIQLDNGKALKLTPKHFIYRSECQNSEWIVPFEKIAESKPVYAEEIRPGDCLYHLAILKDELVFVEKRVTHISLVEEVGIYAPMTGEGNIVVNDILASCQTLLDMPILQSDFFKMIQRWPVISWLLGVFDNKEQSKVELPLGLNFFLDYLGYILPEAFTLSVIYS
ncbi:hint module domain-containing protein [Ditylenchus destructor]|uniref:Hint module domain-containing protein n=1 Tax=Ditylenchus destructor TaxID=166010 RepID=A0AAD4R2H8_9BILA|nr:hint module domain-containing protein [Ditylenchus destructor]